MFEEITGKEKEKKRLIFGEMGCVVGKRQGPSEKRIQIGSLEGFPLF